MSSKHQPTNILLDIANWQINIIYHHLHTLFIVITILMLSIIAIATRALLVSSRCSRWCQEHIEIWCWQQFKNSEAILVYDISYMISNFILYIELTPRNVTKSTHEWPFEVFLCSSFVVLELCSPELRCCACSVTMSCGALRVASCVSERLDKKGAGKTRLFHCKFDRFNTFSISMCAKCVSMSYFQIWDELYPQNPFVYIVLFLGKWWPV